MLPAKVKAYIVPKLTFKNLFIVALIIALIYLVTCNKKKQDDTPKIQTVKEQVLKIVKDSVESKRVLDSMQKIQDGLVKEVVKTEDKYEDTKGVIQNLHETNDGLLAQLKASELTTDIKNVNELLKASERKKDSLCNATKFNLKQQLKNKDGVITQLQKDKKNLNNSIDTCLKNQSILTAENKKNKPKREVTIGARVFSNYTFPLKPNAGLELGYRNKKGTEFSAGYYTNQQVSIGLKKTFLRF